VSFLLMCGLTARIADSSSANAVIGTHNETLSVVAMRIKNVASPRPHPLF
jgi:hypothetical protein